MAELLSITTGVFALLGTCIKVGAALKDFHDGTKSADTRIKALMSSVESFVQTLRLMKDTLEQEKVRSSFQTTGHIGNHWTNIASSIQDGQLTISRLQSVLNKAGKDVKLLDGSRKNVRLKGATDEIVMFQRQIQVHKDTLQLSLQAMVLWNQITFQESAKMLLTNLDELHHAVRRIATDINTLMIAAEDRFDSTSKNEELLALTNLKKCVQSAASVISSASTSLGLDYSEHFSATAESDFEDCFPSHPSPTMLRWMSSNTIYEFGDDNDTNRDLHRGRVSSTQTVAPLNVAEDIHNSDSDSDLEYEIVQALMFRGKEKLAAADLGGAERLFRNCLSRMDSSGSLASIRRSSRTEKSEVISILLEIYLKRENWPEAQSLLIQKMALESRGISKDDGRGLSDMLTLVQVLFRKQAYAEALLYGRRALKGYRKLGSSRTTGVERALRLLIQICHADHNVDEEEAYTAILEKHLTTAPTILDHPAADPVLMADLQTSNFGLSFFDRLERDDLHQHPAATVNQDELSTEADIPPIISIPPITKTILQSGDMTVIPSSESSSEQPIQTPDQDSLAFNHLKRNLESAQESTLSIQLSAHHSPPHIGAGSVDVEVSYEDVDAPTIFDLGQAIIWTPEEEIMSHHAASDTPFSIHKVKSETRTLSQQDTFEYEVSIDHIFGHLRSSSPSSHSFGRDELSPLLVAGFDIERDSTASLSEYFDMEGDSSSSRPEFSTVSKGSAILIPSSNDMIQENRIDVRSTVSPGLSKDTDAVASNYHENTLEREVSRGEEETKLAENYHPNRDEDLSSPQNWPDNTMGVVAERRFSTEIDGAEDGSFENTDILSIPNEPAQSHSLNTTNQEDLDLSIPTELAVGDANSSLSRPHHVLRRSNSAPKLTYHLDISRDNSDWTLTRLHYSGPTRTSNHSDKSTGHGATTTHVEFGDSGRDKYYIDSSKILGFLRQRSSIIRKQRQASHLPPMTVVPLIPEPQQMKIVLIGDGAVGKTALLRCFISNEFSGAFDSNPGFNHFRWVAHIENTPRSIAAADTPGQPEHGRMRSLEYEDAHALMICFAIDSPDSAENVEDNWAMEAAAYCKNIPWILVGLKKDLRDDKKIIERLSVTRQHPVTWEEGEVLRRKIGAVSYVECSARLREGLDDAIGEAVSYAMTVLSSGDRKKKNKRLSLRRLISKSK